ncbi:MAG: hypothetical protein AB1490_05390 [Pseudomonadota bacterium]
MAPAPKPKKARPKVRKRAEPPDHEHYVFRITDWEWSFSFGAGFEKDGKHADYRHLEVFAEIARPKRYAGRKASLTFLPEIMFNVSRFAQQEVKHAGFLTVKPKLMEGLISMPADALPLILPMLIAGRFKFAVASCDPMRHRRARIVRFSLEQDVMDDHLPPEV